jgi:hypothetical protein
MHKFPKLLEDVSKENAFDLNNFLESGIPWIKLNIDVPEFAQQVFDEAVAQSSDWRKQWFFSNETKSIEVDYQVNNWNGSLLFGPTDWNKWQAIVESDSDANDADHLCLIHRKSLNFEWRLDAAHPIRQFVEKIFPNVEDINIVNFFVLPPGGYLFPHIDPTVGTRALNKIYIPLSWKEGNEFGFYKWGNAPFVESRAYLINNYSNVHWVLNRSSEPRIVLDIGANLYSIHDLIKESFYDQCK